MTQMIKGSHTLSTGTVVNWEYTVAGVNAIVTVSFTGRPSVAEVDEEKLFVDAFRSSLARIDAEVQGPIELVTKLRATQITTEHLYGGSAN